MKKLFLTAVVALSALVASAQFMVVTTYDNDLTESSDKITGNMGIGYMVNDAFTVGLAKSTTQEALDANADDVYNVWVRYNIAQVEGAYASLEVPTDENADGDRDMRLGLGFSFNVWNGLYVEPNYTMPTAEDADGKREGSFNFGLAYRF
jgi:hypothetical protein